MDGRQHPFDTDAMALSGASEMDDDAFSIALLQSALSLAADVGWNRMSLVEAARDAGLPVETVRRRYPMKSLILLQLGRMADASALRDDGNGGSLRDYLFDLIMRRFDIFQEYREGVRAVLQALPYDPALAGLLAATTFDSMKWLADAAGLDCVGLGGVWRINAVTAVWAHAMRAWEKDESPDLSATMAALDNALDRADRLGVLKPSARRKMDDAMNNTGIPDHDLELES